MNQYLEWKRRSTRHSVHINANCCPTERESNKTDRSPIRCQALAVLRLAAFGSDARRARARCLSSACRSEEHTSELQSRGHLVCRLLLEKKKINHTSQNHYTDL